MRIKTGLPARRAIRPTLALCLLALCLSGGAQAQWAWRAPNGNTTFSDTPPPSDVQPTQILRQPSAQALSNPNDNAQSNQSPSYTTPGGYSNVQAPAPSTPAPADFRKRTAEREKAEQKQSADETQATQRAASCNQAKGYLQMIESGTRLMRPDAEGNRNFLDEDQRAAEVQKTQEIIAKDC
jgi:hypothetical protein